jgi:hypothetical protein
MFPKQVYRSPVKHDNIPTITKDHVTQALADDNKVFSDLRGSEFPVSRSFPSQADLTPEALSTLLTILENGYIPFDESSAGIKRCYQYGWIQRAIQEDSQRNVGVLPSRLHEK